MSLHWLLDSVEVASGRGFEGLQLSVKGNWESFKLEKRANRVKMFILHSISNVGGVVWGSKFKSQ